MDESHGLRRKDIRIKRFKKNVLSHILEYFYTTSWNQVQQRLKMDLFQHPNVVTSVKNK